MASMIRCQSASERVVDLGAAGKVGGDCVAALLLHCAGDGRADRAGGSGHQDDFVFQPIHLRRAPVRSGNS
jgi:hypothetical protein